MSGVVEVISLIEQDLKYHYQKQQEHQIEYMSHLIYTQGFRLNIPPEIKRYILGGAISNGNIELFESIVDLLYCNILDVRDAIRLINNQKEIPRLTSKRKIMGHGI